MTRRPPRSPLFPYTTLFRSQQNESDAFHGRPPVVCAFAGVQPLPRLMASVSTEKRPSDRIETVTQAWAAGPSLRLCRLKYIHPPTAPSELFGRESCCWILISEVAGKRGSFSCGGLLSGGSSSVSTFSSSSKRTISITGTCPFAAYAEQAAPAAVSTPRQIL